MEIIRAAALISINETFYVQLISFLIFLYLLNRVMIRPLLGTINERKTYLEVVNVEIETAAGDLRQLHEDLDRQRASVLKEANTAVHQIEEEAEHNAADVLASAQREITQLRQETEIQVNAQVKQARAQLSGEVDTLTTLIMEKVLHRRMTS